MILSDAPLSPENSLAHMENNTRTGDGDATADEELQTMKVPIDPKELLLSNFEMTTIDNSTSHNDTSSALAGPGQASSPQNPNQNSIMTLNEWARQIKNNYFNSRETAEVTIEQLERIRVVHDRFLDACSLSFNYNTLILVASVIAACGLVSNSVASIIASMLVSPIMGPVVGMAYGTTIRDWRMVKRSFINEIGSLAFCILMGAVIGAIAGTTTLADDFPTEEMWTRGTTPNLLVGLPVAFFSGLGVAVSLLDDQFSPLVGVAISASLLPPAVNAGVLWAAYPFYKRDMVTNSQDLEYTQADFLFGGFISLLLTIANIVLIWLAAMIMFRMKEVLPMRKKVFWADLGVARKIFQDKAVVCYENEDGNLIAKADWPMERSVTHTSQDDVIYRQAAIKYEPKTHSIREDPV